MIRKNAVNKKKLIWIFVVSTATLLSVYLFYLYPKKADIYVINNSNLQFGETNLAGIIQKDSAVGVEGNYFLIIPNQKPILLDVQHDSDHLVGRKVILHGTLFPESKTGQPMTFKVITITLE